MNPDAASLRTGETTQPRLTWPWLSLALIALLVSLHLVLDYTGGRHWLWLDTERLVEPWRFVTAHLTHTNTEHLVWNCAALLMLGGWLETTRQQLLLPGLAVGIAAVSIWFVLFAPTQLYVGLSGALNSLLVIVLGTEALKAYGNQDRLTLAIVALFFIGSLLKVLSELLLDFRFLSIGEWRSAPGAHAAGMLSGSAYFLLTRSRAP